MLFKRYPYIERLAEEVSRATVTVENESNNRL
jgi:hypothetical protein